MGTGVYCYKFLSQYPIPTCTYYSPIRGLLLLSIEVTETPERSSEHVLHIAAAWERLKDAA